MGNYYLHILLHDVKQAISAEFLEPEQIPIAILQSFIVKVNSFIFSSNLI